MKPNAFSASINFRATSSGSFRLFRGFVIISFLRLSGSFWTNIKKFVGYQWPIGYLTRSIFEDADDFQTASKWFENSILVAPCYFSICGTKSREGILLTRGTNSSEQKKTIGNSNDDCFFVQTNMDHFSEDLDMDILNSIERRNRASKMIKTQMKSSSCGVTFLWNLLSTPPIMNDITIYATYMNPNSNIFETRLPDKRKGFL
jgi:hypothetical protein